MSSGGLLSSINRLTGRDNYDDWKFAAEAYFKHEGLWKYVQTEFVAIALTSDATATQKEKAATESHNAEKALSKLILLLDSVNYVHVRNAKSAAEAWNNLTAAFQDNGMTRKIGILRQLVSTKLVECDSVEIYVNRIINTAHRLRNIGMDVPDEWVGALLLAGLPEEYGPMLMGLESSGIKITADAIKTKLLQDVKSAAPIRDAEAALAAKFSTKRRQRDKSKVRCYNCNEFGHYSRECKSKAKTDRAYLTSFVARRPIESDDWYIDSGASGHMTMRNDLVVDRRSPITEEVVFGDDSRLRVECAGNVHLTVRRNGRSASVLMKDVQYIPGICANLISLGQLYRQGNSVAFNNNGCAIYDGTRQLIATASMIGNMYKLDLVPADKCFATQSDKMSKHLLWHRRLGHPGHDKMRRLYTGLAEGIDSMSTTNEPCDVCAKGKQTRRPFGNAGNRANQLLELVHSDVCGPMQTASLGGAKYFLLFIDDFSRMTFVYFLRAKSEVVDRFVEFKQFVENQLERKIKILRSDNGTEYMNQRMAKILERNGILHQTSTPHTPQQNGLAERMNRTVVEKARCMLFDAKINTSFWAEAVSTAIYLINRLPSSGTGKTPYEIWYGRKPDLTQLRVFGCKAMSHVPKANRTKFKPKSIECTMVGYSEKSKAYRLYDKSKCRIVLSRDVIFIENQFANDEVIDFSNLSNHFPIFDSEADESNATISTVAQNDCDGPINANENQANDFALNEGDFGDQNESSKEENLTADDSQSTNNSVDHATADNYDDFVDAEGSAMPANSTVISISDDDTLANASPDPIAAAPAEPENRYNGLPYRQAAKKCIDSLKNISFAVVSAEVGDPTSVQAAMSRSDANMWRDAMDDEHKSLIENETWQLVNLPPNRRPIDCKWVFKTKRDTNGNVSRYKARLVIKGCAQRKGIDYEETYAPVVRYTSIRYLMSIAAKFDLQIDQMDAVTAFLHGKLDEDIFMLQPQGYSDGTSKVCHLRKSLYGLKQASHVWNAKLNAALLDFGLTRSKQDPCIYYKRNGRKLLVVAIYVDDMLLLSNDTELKSELKIKLSSTFRMKDLGQATSVLGMNVTRDVKNGTIAIDQSNYIKEILARFGLADCNPVSSPMDVNVKLSSQMCPKNNEERQQMERIPYQEAVGSLMHTIQVSRPDICYAVSVVSRYNNNPGNSHWLAVKRIFRYLKGSIDRKLVFNGKGNGDIVGFCDADWAGDLDHRKSTTGYVFKMNDAAISWNSRKQQTVAISTTEAEYMSLAAAAQEAIWLRKLNHEIVGGSNRTIEIHCDNKSAIQLASTAMYHPRTKHIDVKYHFIREQIEMKSIAVKYVGTDDQIADVFTKPLVPLKHKGFIDKCGII